MTGLRIADHRGVCSLLSLIFILPLAAAAQAPSATAPARRGVDIYNSVGSSVRLVSFMKIGAAPADLRYLGYLNARVNGKKPPRAFLAGQTIYFRGIAEPLRIVDLKQQTFTLNGHRLELLKAGTIQQKMSSLELALRPRRAAQFLWDILFPSAVAASDDPSTLAALSGVLAAAGLTAGAHCLNDPKASDCGGHFMGRLAALGSVGGLRAAAQPAKVFCNPDFRGGQSLVISDEARNSIEIKRRNGEIDVNPVQLNSGSPSSDKAASELLATCTDEPALASMNIALSYPTSQSPKVIAKPVVTPITNVTTSAVPYDAGGTAHSETAR